MEVTAGLRRKMELGKTGDCSRQDKLCKQRIREGKVLAIIYKEGAIKRLTWLIAFSG